MKPASPVPRMCHRATSSHVQPYPEIGQIEPERRREEEQAMAPASPEGQQPVPSQFPTSAATPEPPEAESAQFVSY